MKRAGVLLAWVCAVGCGAGVGRPAGPVTLRTVGFDNRYAVTTLRVHVRVDAGREQTLMATCDPQTCAFQLPLSEGRHDLLISVEQNGIRSQFTPMIVGVATNVP